MVTVKLSAMPYAQAKVVISDNGDIALQSYETVVALIHNGRLFINGLYSMTTRKHISAFVKEYAGLSYQVAKDLYLNNWCYNLCTGEIMGIGD